MTSRISDAILIEVLERASDEERLAISQAVRPSAVAAFNPDELHRLMALAAGHRVFNAIRGVGVSYGELLSDSADALGLQEAPSYFSRTKLGWTMSELDNMKSAVADGVPEHVRVEMVDSFVDLVERLLLTKLLSVAYDRATPEQRRAIDAGVKEFSKTTGDKRLAGLPTAAALLAVGNLGGFATYTLASTVLSALSFGSLGFGAYTFASSALSVLLGPVGWLALGLAAAAKLGGPRKSEVVRVAATAALTSQRIREQRRRR